MSRLRVMKDFAARKVGDGRPLSSKHAVMTFYDEAGVQGCHSRSNCAKSFNVGGKMLQICSNVQEEPGYGQTHFMNFQYIL